MLKTAIKCIHCLYCGAFKLIVSKGEAHPIHLYYVCLVNIHPSGFFFFFVSCSCNLRAGCGERFYCFCLLSENKK